MKKLKKAKVEIRVNGKSALDSKTDVFVSTNEDGSFEIKTRLGKNADQEFLMVISPFTEILSNDN